MIAPEASVLCFLAYAEEGSITDDEFDLTSLGTWNELVSLGGVISLTGANEFTVQKDCLLEIEAVCDMWASTHGGNDLGGVFYIARNELDAGDEMNAYARQLALGCELTAVSSSGPVGGPGLASWSGRARAGDVFRVAANAVTIGEATSEITGLMLRVSARYLGGPGREYAGQKFWTIALDAGDVGVHRGLTTGSDLFLAEATEGGDVPSEDTDEIILAVNRETEETVYQAEEEDNEPIFLATGFTGGLPCVGLSASASFENDANAGDYDGTLSHAIVLTFECDNVGDVRTLWYCGRGVGGSSVRLSVDSGTFRIIRTAPGESAGLFTGGTVTTTPQTVVWSYDGSTGLTDLWSINADGSTVTHLVQGGDMGTGALVDSDQRRIGLQPSEAGFGGSSFRWRRFREVVGKSIRVPQVAEIAREIARDDA